MPKVLSPSDVANFREKLCEAATRLFAAKGRDGFSMREVAGELGVSPMTAYRYFKDKDEILAAVRTRAFDRFAEKLEAAYAKAPDAAARGAEVGGAYTSFAFAEPASYRLMFDMSQPNEANYPGLVRATARARRTMTDYVRDLVAGGVLEGDPDLIGHVFWASLHGAVVLELAGKLSEQDFREISATAFRALSAGFAPKR